MAFVFRSPRNLDSLSPTQASQIDSAYETESEPEKQCETKKNSGKLIKGFRCKKKQGQESIEKQFYIAKNDESIQKIKKKSQPDPVAPKKKQQFFFKSKSKREFQKTPQSLKLRKSEDEIQQQQQIIHKEKKESPRKSHRSKDSKKTAKKQQKISEHQSMLQTNRKDIEGFGRDRIQQDKSAFGKNREVKGLERTLNLLSSKKQISTVFGVPSIPGKQERFGYVVKENKLFYPKMVPKPRYQGRMNDSPGPTDYHISESKKTKGVMKFSSCSHSKHEKLKNDQVVRYAALLNDQEALKMHNQKIREWVYKGKEQRNKKKKQLCKQKQQRSQLQTRDLTNESEQQGDFEYEFDTTPGPGYYPDNFSSVNNKKSFRSKNEKFAKIYLSQCQRFPKEILCKYGSQIGENSNSLHSQFKSNGKFYISKLKRGFALQKRESSPPPGHYDTRISLQNEVISDILRNSPKLFDNNLPRLAQTVNSATPGPGHYDHKMPNFKVESYNNANSLNQKPEKKQKQETKLKPYEQILVQNCPRPTQSESIHQKPKQNQAQKRAPFLSSSPKKMDLNPQRDYQTELPKLCPQNPYKTNKENIYPFNSSEAKNAGNNLSYGAQVGLYTIQDINGWDKKSFNVLFN